MVFGVTLDVGLLLWIVISAAKTLAACYPVLQCCCYQCIYRTPSVLYFSVPASLISTVTVLCAFVRRMLITGSRPIRRHAQATAKGIKNPPGDHRHGAVPRWKKKRFRWNSQAGGARAHSRREPTDETRQRCQFAVADERQLAETDLPVETRKFPMHRFRTGVARRWSSVCGCVSTHCSVEAKNAPGSPKPIRRYVAIGDKGAPDFLIPSLLTLELTTMPSMNRVSRFGEVCRLSPEHQWCRMQTMPSACRFRHEEPENL
jgi:hypothetical protein